MTVHFIGAGPGAADLITVRGLEFIRACPLVLYAGSLVPAELVGEAGAEARVVDSAPLDLDAIDARTAILGLRRVVLDEVADFLVFQKQSGKFLLGSVPATLPSPHHPGTEANWINFLTHGRFSFP